MAASKFEFLQLELLGEGVKLLVGAVHLGRIALGRIEAVTGNGLGQISVVGLEVGQGLAELGRLQVVSQAEVSLDKRVQMGVGGLFVAYGLLILRHGGEDQFVLAAVVQKGVVAEQGVLEGGGFSHPAQPLHQHKAIAALLETAGGLGLAAFFLYLLQQGLGGVVDVQTVLQGIQVHGNGLQIEAGPESPVVFPQGL